MHVNCLYNILEVWDFFPELCDTRGPLGGLRGLGGAPPRGVPQTGTPPAIIRIFYVSGISFNNYLGIISKKNGTDRTSGAPQGYAPPQNTPPIGLGPPGLGRSRFLGLICLHNYSKIFQKHRLFNFLLGGPRRGSPPWGGQGPPRGPQKSQSFGKNSQNSKILYK